MFKRLLNKYRAIITMTITSLIIASFPVGLNAQGTVDSDMVRTALERTDEIIRSAYESILESRSSRGRMSLEKARALQEKAWELFKANRLKMAISLTLQAREEAWHAMSLARLDTQTEGQLTRTVESTYEKLIRLREVIIENAIRDHQTLKLMEEAKNLLEKSTINAKQLHFQLALKLATSSRNLANRAEERVRRILRVKEVAGRKIASMERLLERVRERVDREQDKSIAKRIAIAERELERARRFVREGEYQKARQAINTTEKILRSLARNAEGIDSQRIQRRIEETYRLLDRAMETIANTESVNPRAEEALAEAKALLNKSQEALMNDRKAESMRLVEQARKMILNVTRKLKREANAEDIMRRIEEVEKMRSEVREIARNCTKKGIERLFERAEVHINRAKEMLRGKRLEQASAEVQITINIYERIKEICAL